MMAEFMAGVLYDGSHVSAEEYDITVIDIAMDHGFKPVENGQAVFDLLFVEREDAWQVIAEIGWDAVEWMNNNINLPEGHYVGIHPEETQLLGVWPLDWN